MERVEPRKLSGFMELLPQDQMKMERLIETLRSTYSLYGFTPLDTPLMEASEVLLAKGGGETEKQIYRLTKGDSDLALRFDLTVPLAKFVAANYGSLCFPFRRFQIGKVYRGERAQRGRFREFYQADIDIIGDGELNIMNEAEIPSVIYRTFTSLGLKNFVIKVNNRKLLNGFFEFIEEVDNSALIMHAVDKHEKIGTEKLMEQLIELGLSEQKANLLVSFILFKGSTKEKLDHLEKFEGTGALFKQGISELRAVTDYLSEFGVPEDRFELDFSVARGLDYYTGTVYETILKDHPEIGSICSGGRYDDLAAYYTQKKLPGVGISIGVTRLFYVLNEQGMLGEGSLYAPADVLVIPMTEDLGLAVSTANYLRDCGIRTQLYTEKKKFKARLSYADKLGIPFVLLLGEDEIKSGMVSLKNMSDGAQELIDVRDAANRIASFKAEQSKMPLICDLEEKK